MAAAAPAVSSSRPPSDLSSSSSFNNSRLPPPPSSSFKWFDADKWLLHHQLPPPDSPSLPHTQPSSATFTPAPPPLLASIPTSTTARNSTAARKTSPPHADDDDTDGHPDIASSNKLMISPTTTSSAAANHRRRLDAAALVAADHDDSAAAARHASFIHDDDEGDNDAIATSSCSSRHSQLQRSSPYNTKNQLSSSSGTFAFPSPTVAPPAAASPTPADVFYFFPAGAQFDDDDDVVVTGHRYQAKDITVAKENSPSAISMGIHKPKLYDSPNWNRKPDLENARLELHCGATPATPTSRSLFPVCSPSAIYNYNSGSVSSARLRSMTTSTNMRDMGTEMTPMASQEPSLTATPVPAATPTIHSPTSGNSSASSSPQRESQQSKPTLLLLSEELRQSMEAADGTIPAPPHIKDELVLIRLAYKDNGGAAASTPETHQVFVDEKKRTVGNVGDDSKLLKGMDMAEVKKTVLATKAVTWEEAEQEKSMARFQRELAQIQAWETHQKAKAEAEMKRTEVKIERMKVMAQEKLVNKLAAAKKRAEERRAAAEARQMEAAAMASESAHYIRRTRRLPPIFVCCARS